MSNLINLSRRHLLRLPITALAPSPSGNRSGAFAQSRSNSTERSLDKQEWVNIKTDFGAVGDGVTNDSSAFLRFRTWGRKQKRKINLVIPPGYYINRTFPNQWAFDGISDVTVHGYGATVDTLNFGSFRGLAGSDNLHSSRIKSASSSQSTVTLIKASEYSRYAEGDWIYISGIDLQGYGSPPNHHFFEYQHISSVNSTGVITLGQKLRCTYKETWPNFEAGNAKTLDLGGPATIYKMDPHWNCSNKIYGLTVKTSAGVLFNGRHVEYVDCYFDGPSWPTMCQTHVARRCRFGGQVEVDKGIEFIKYENCTASLIIVQSSSVDRFELEGCKLSNSLNGTAKNTVVRSCDMPGLFVGPLGYGQMESLLIENSRIGSIAITGSVGTLSQFRLTAGTFIMPKAKTGPVLWATPGGWMRWGNSEITGQPFKILDLREDGTNVYIDTTLPANATIPISAYSPFTTTKIRAYRPNIRVINSHGCPEIIDMMSSDGAWGTYAKRTYTGSFGQAPGFHVWGQLVYVKINVLRAYTGALSSLTVKTNQNLNIFTIKDDNTSYKFGATVNLKIAGERVIAPGSTTGGQTGDSLPSVDNLFIVDYTDNGVWGAYLSGNISGETRDTWPIVSIEVKTDHGSYTGLNWYNGTDYVN
jgi:hypothetical protein